MRRYIFITDAVGIKTIQPLRGRPNSVSAILYGAVCQLVFLCILLPRDKPPPFQRLVVAFTKEDLTITDQTQISGY